MDPTLALMFSECRSQNTALQISLAKMMDQVADLHSKVRLERPPVLQCGLPCSTLIDAARCFTWSTFTSAAGCFTCSIYTSAAGCFSCSAYHFCKLCFLAAHALVLQCALLAALISLLIRNNCILWYVHSF